MQAKYELICLFLLLKDSEFEAKFFKQENWTFWCKLSHSAMGIVFCQSKITTSVFSIAKIHSSTEKIPTFYQLFALGGIYRHTGICVFSQMHRKFSNFFYHKKSKSGAFWSGSINLYKTFFFHFEDFKSCVCIELWKIIFSFKFLKIKKVELHFTRWAVIKVSIEKKSYKFWRVMSNAIFLILTMII